MELITCGNMEIKQVSLIRGRGLSICGRGSGKNFWGTEKVGAKFFIMQKQGAEFTIDRHK